MQPRPGRGRRRGKHGWARRRDVARRPAVGRAGRPPRSPRKLWHACLSLPMWRTAPRSRAGAPTPSPSQFPPWSASPPLPCSPASVRSWVTRWICTPPPTAAARRRRRRMGGTEGRHVAQSPALGPPRRMLHARLGTPALPGRCCPHETTHEIPLRRFEGALRPKPPPTPPTLTPLQAPRTRSPSSSRAPTPPLSRARPRCRSGRTCTSRRTTRR